MNKKKLLLTLAIGMMLGGCKKVSDGQSENKTLTDTMLVIGVWNQPRAYTTPRRKSILAINKKGVQYKFLTPVCKNGVFFDNGETYDWILPYIERGDTIYVENGRIVKNLTMDHMAERYVNGR